MRVDGHIDFYGWDKCATGWFVTGWLDSSACRPEAQLAFRFSSGVLDKGGVVKYYKRVDLNDNQLGFLIFLPDRSPRRRGELVSLELIADGELTSVVPDPAPPVLKGPSLRSELASLISALQDGDGQIAAPFKLARRAHEIEVIRSSGLIDASFYKRNADTQIPADVCEHFYDIGHNAGFKPNFYFDPKWYLKTYSDAAQRGFNSLYHYIKWGEREGRHPSPIFDPIFYRTTYGIDDHEYALQHYLKHYRERKYSPVAEFDVADYLRTRGRAIPTRTDPFQHYLAGQRGTSRSTMRTRGRNDAAEPAETARPYGTDDPALWTVSPGMMLDPSKARTFINLVLSSPFVDDNLCQTNLGTGKRNPYTAERYLQLPVSARPKISYLFDNAYYIARYRDIALAAGVDPLVHFILTGCQEKRSPHPLFDLGYMTNSNYNLLSTEPSTIELYNVIRANLVDPSPYFLIDEYRKQLDADTDMGYLLHYLTEGYAVGLKPNLLWDPGWYYRQLAGLEDVWSGLRHFVLIGDKDGRAPSPAFDSARYRDRYPDVSAAGIPPLLHYLQLGRQEGRSFGPLASQTITANPSEGSSADTAAAAATYRRNRNTVNHRQQQKKDALSPTPVDIRKITDPRAFIRTLEFPHHGSPKVSILIPVYNELKHTVECLASILRSKPKVTYEVVIADDASTNQMARQLRKIGNITYVDQRKNLGFLENCNQALPHCRGEYLFLLNNDAQLLPGALDALVHVLETDPQVGAVGPKILYPDGRLQEAGCVLDRDGISTMIGLFDDPSAPGYAYDRDIHYASGAALLIRRSAIGDVLFDPAFKPAYCEDADLCLRLLSNGLRVVYCHQSQVVHHLSVSIDKHSTDRRLQRIIKNQQKLTEKWAPTLDTLNTARLIAMYLPQFYTTPENDFHWGRGFTEWRNVAKAKPAYVGHYQPHLPADLGFYDLRVRETIERQAALARRYGIAGFCVYYYNFGDHKTLDKVPEAVIADKTIDFPFCICWANENWTRRWDGGSSEIIFEQRYDDAALSGIISDATRYASDARYLRVNDKPLFLVYRPLLVPEVRRFTEMVRNAFHEAGHGGVHLVYVESMETAQKAVPPEQLGFDASVEFPPHGQAMPVTAEAQVIRDGFVGSQYDYEATYVADLEQPLPGCKRYPAVFPSWDNTPRQPLRGDSFVGATPEAFQVYVEEKLEYMRNCFIGDERLLFVNAWNEWAEGTHLEPDMRFGHRWLEAIRDALLAKSLL